MNEIYEKAIDELAIDELDAVNGGCKLSEVIDRVVAIYHYLTRTVPLHATTLP